MSHTDKTRPHWVKILEHPREVHDHRNGVCELADGTFDIEGPWTRDSCSIEAQWWRPEFRCGCALCGEWGNPGRIARYAARRELRRYVPEED